MATGPRELAARPWPGISIVVPVYRAAASLPELHRRLTAVASALADPYEIVFVEDCGGDESWHLIQGLAEQDDRVRGLRIFSRHRFFKAATMFALPALLIFRLWLWRFWRGWRRRRRFAPYFGPSKLLGFLHSPSSGCGELPALDCGRFRRGGGCWLGGTTRPAWPGVLRSVCRYAAFLVQSRRWRR